MIEIWLGSLLLVIGTAVVSFMVLFFREIALSSLICLGGRMITALAVGFLSDAIKGLFSLLDFGFMRVFEGSLPVGIGFGGVPCFT